MHEHGLRALKSQLKNNYLDLKSRTILDRNVQWFQGGLVFQAHRLVHHSTLGLRVIKKRRELTSGIGPKLILATSLEPLPGSNLSWKTPRHVAPVAATWLALLHELLHRNVQRFRGGLVSKAHRLVYHSTLGWREMKKEEAAGPWEPIPGVSSTKTKYPDTYR